MAVVEQADVASKRKKFVPQTEFTDYYNPYYITTAYGGYNLCIIGNGPPVPGSVLPNCTGYAWGRFMEILGETPRLSRGNAGDWYNANDGYERGQTPQVGAVMCWSNPGDAGHVAIVEQINPDGSLIISESGWNYRPGTYFRSYSMNPPYNYYGYHFQGFIYNPASSYLSDSYSIFVDTATDLINKDGKDIIARYNLSKNNSWNTLFISYCAEQAEFKASVPIRKSATDFITDAVINYNATWHDGPQLGNRSYIPEAGDIICLVSDANKKRSNKYYADRLAIVTDVTDLDKPTHTVVVVEGDVGGKVVSKSYASTASIIKGYLELDWANSGVSRAGTIYVSSELYDTLNDQDDAIMREVSFISGDTPTVTKTDIKLSVINYTSHLATLFKYYDESITSSSDSIASYLSSDITTYEGTVTNLSTNTTSITTNRDISMQAVYNDSEVVGDIIFNDPMTYGGANTSYSRNNGSIIFKELIRQGITASVAIGIMAYMWSESKWNPADIVEAPNQPSDYYSRGLCHWSLTWSVEFVSAVPNWETNITGQIQFCVSQMKSKFGQLYQYLRSLKNTEKDAIKAATQFSLSYGLGYGFVSEDKLELAISQWNSEYSGKSWEDTLYVASYMWNNNITVLTRQVEVRNKVTNQVV